MTPVYWTGGLLKVKLEFGDVEGEPERNKLLRYLIRLVLLTLFIIPMGFISTYVVTMIHEVLGHVVAGLLVGGSVEGLEIHWTGQGLATLSLPSTSYELSLVYMAGVFANIITGLIILRLSLYRSIPFFPRLAMLMIAADSIISAGPVYIFWNSLFTVKDYDFTQLLALYDSAGLRVFFVCVGLALMLLAIAIVSILTYQTLSEWLNSGRKDKGAIRGYPVFVPLLVIFLADTSKYITNALLIDIGWWTILVMVCITLLVLAGIYYIDPEIPRLDLSRKKAVAPIIAAVICAIVLFFLTLFLI